MTASAEGSRIVGPDAPVGDGRHPDLILAGLHLRLGSLSLARAELETLAGAGILDPAGLVDLAEARWRTGDLPGAGEAAAAAIREGHESIVALVIAAESTADQGRPGEARKLAGRALELNAGPIDRIFAGMPRASIWPVDPVEARTPRAAGTERTAAERATAGRRPAGRTADHLTTSSGHHGRGIGGPGLWDVDEDADEATLALPDPADELDAGRNALADGDDGQAALRLGLVLRIAPALAPAVIETLANADGAELEIVRGDAYHLVGHEREARQAYAAAAAEVSNRARRLSRADEDEDPRAEDETAGREPA
jgi:hypothetical protein